MFKIKNLTFNHPVKENEFLIKGLNLEIKESTIALLIGESGSGKTTILNSIVGKRTSLYSNGDFDYFGNEYSQDVFVEDISYIPQNYPLFDEVTVEENVLVSFQNSVNYFKTLYPDFNINDVDNFDKGIIKSIKKHIKTNKLSKQSDNLDAEIIKVFNSLNLSYEDIKRRKPTQLSGGQRQRLSIACALLKKPKLIIMDEPFANLDNKTSLQVMEYIIELKKQGISFLISSHDIEVLEGHEDFAILLSGKGEWIKGKVNEFKNDRTNQWVASYFNPYFNVIDEKIYLEDEIKVSKTKSKKIAKVIKINPWKEQYKVIIEYNENELKIITDKKLKVKETVYLVYE